MSFKASEPVVCATICDTAVCIAYFCRTRYISAIIEKTKTFITDQCFYTKDLLLRLYRMCDYHTNKEQM